MAARSTARLEVVPEHPAEEPILIEWEQDGAIRSLVVEADDPAWTIAYLWREKEGHLKDAEKSLRKERAAVSQLHREKTRAAEKERRAHPDRDFVEELFEEWRNGVGKPRCKLTPERCDMALARLDEDYEREHLREAVQALLLNPWVINGDAKRDWKTALKTGEAVEAHANRCPAEKRREIRGQLFDVQPAAA